MSRAGGPEGADVVLGRRDQVGRVATRRDCLGIAVVGQDSLRLEASKDLDEVAKLVLRYTPAALREVDELAGPDELRRARLTDKLGVAFVTNGISESHKDYLAFGGKGFLLGDGKLHYGREDILEAYYTARVYRGVYPALDVQAIVHPGYNTDRGPAIVGSIRLHLEI